MSAGANTHRVRIFSALNVLGWVVVMPVLVVAAMSPFVNFAGLGAAKGDEARAAQVALLPPRLSEHGSLPQLTEAPQASAAVPVHRTIAVGFTPAPASTASTRKRSAPVTRRRVANRPGSTSTRRRSDSRRNFATRPARTPAAQAPRPVAPAKPPAREQPQSAPSRPANPGNSEKPHKPAQPSQPAKPGNGNGRPQDKPAPAQSGPAQGNGKPQQDSDPGRSSAPADSGPGKSEDRGHGRQGNGKG